MNTVFRITAAILTLCLAAAAPAAAAAVRYDLDPTADMAGWRGWAWQPSRPDSHGLQDARIRRALEAGFAARGYSQVGVEAADFRVAYRAGARQDLRLSETWSPGFGRDLRVAKQAKGLLLVDVYDAATGRLVWRGAVEDVLAKDPARADKKVDKAVAKLLAKFPARQI